ncbi:MAG: oxidoreductase [Cyanobacteria bacterium P01_F01_bin.53]
MGNVILITGGSSGMGLETAKLLAQEGYKVYAGARRTERLEALRELGIVPVQMDVTDPETNQKVVEQIMANEGRIDVLINNAGFGLYGPVEDVSLEDARYQFDVNLFGLAHLTQLVLPHMRQQKSGRIINTSSMGGKIYTPLGAWYHATKHALEGWSDCLRIETKPFNIQVVLVEPGGVKTEFGDVTGKQLQKYYDNSAYQKQMEPFLKMMQDPRAMDNATDPVVLARVFVEAVKAKKPKRRYVKGAMAKPLMFVRKWLGDGVYEFMLSRAFS